MNVLEIKDLCKKYDGFELKKINLNIPESSIVGLIGENGAGKTTLIKSILNLISIDQGEIKIFGLDNIKDEAKIKQDIGVVLDDSFLSEYLNPNDINKIMKSLYNTWDEKKYFKYIDSFKLPREKISKEYSSGMKMKLKIAVAISHSPKFLILDEATSGLDPIARSEIIDLLNEFVKNEKCSILISTHITSDLEHIADSIVFINNGNIILNKTRQEMLNNYGIVRCSEEEFKKIDKKDYIKFKKDRYEYSLLIENQKDFKKKYKIKMIEKPSLEDIMLLMIKGE